MLVRVVFVAVSGDCLPGSVNRRGTLGYHFTEMCSGSEAGSYLRRIDSWITQLKAQGPSRTCNESKEEETLNPNAGRSRSWTPRISPPPLPRLTCQRLTCLARKGLPPRAWYTPFHRKGLIPRAWYTLTRGGERRSLPELDTSHITPLPPSPLPRVCCGVYGCFPHQQLT